MRLLCLLHLFLSLFSSARAEVLFLAPNTTRPLFKRDLLPLETDRIRELSQCLTVLVGRENREINAAGSRAEAQLLVLALQLDPVNRPARRILRDLEAGRAPRMSSRDELSRKLSQLEEITSWLLLPAAGSEGRLLAHLIVDPLRVLFPDLPLCRLAGPDGEADRWRGTVPPVTAYLRSQPPQAPPKRTQKAVPEEAPSATEKGPHFSPDAFSLRTPLYLERPGGQSGQQIVAVQVSPLSTPQTTSLLRFPGESEKLRLSLENSVRLCLRRLWRSLPPNEGFQVSLAHGSYHKRNGLALSGPLALMLHASLCKAALRPDLHVLGQVSKDGQLTLPARGWAALKSAFSDERTQGRVLVPATTTVQMRDLLVLEHYDFFTRFEVFAVESLEEALAAGRSESSTELAEASRLFREFQRVAQGKQLGELSSNSHVRSRMENILRLAPNHLSAKMVLLHGSPARPLKLSPLTVAKELEDCLGVLAGPIQAKGISELTPASLLRTRNKCLEAIKALRDHTHPDQAPLLGRFEITAGRLRKLARSIEEIGLKELEYLEEFSPRRLSDINAQRRKYRSEVDSLRVAVNALKQSP